MSDTPRTDAMLPSMNSAKGGGRRQDFINLCRTLERDLAAANAEREELIGALEMMWDQYENGTQCYEDPDEHAGYLGHAVNLSADEEQRVLALIPAQCSAAIDAAIAARKP